VKKFNRINIDGVSITETLPCAVAINPGVFVVRNSGEFAIATAVSGQMFVMTPANHQGLGISDAVPQDASGVAEYVQEGRELALRVGEGTYTEGQALTMSNTGVAIAIPAVAGDYEVVAYVQEPLTVAAGEFDFAHVRIGRQQVVTVA